MIQKRYLRSENTETTGDVTSSAHDLDLTVGAAQALNTDGVTAGTFAETMVFDMDIRDDQPSPGSLAHSTSVETTLASSDMEWKFRLQVLNLAGTVLASSGYSTTYSAVGTHTDTLTLIWADTGVRLRLSVETRSTGSGTKTLRATAASNSWVNSPWVSRLKMISDEILTRVQGVTLANGFQNTIGDTGVQRTPSDEVVDVPACFIWSRSVLDRASATGGRDARGAKQATAEITLFLSTQGGASPGDDLLKFAEDIVKAIEQDDPALGLDTFGVWEVNVRELQDITVEDETIKPYGHAFLPVEVQYRHRRGTL